MKTTSFTITLNDLTDNEISRVEEALIKLQVGFEQDLGITGGDYVDITNTVDDSTPKN